MSFLKDIIEIINTHSYHMKKTLSLIMILFLTIQIHAETIEKTYFYNDFQVKASKSNYFTIDAVGAFNTAILGQPLLPWYVANFVLPPGEEIESVEFIGLDMVTLVGNYQLMPKQYVQPISKGKSGEFAKDISIYQSEEAYPSNGNKSHNTQFWAGHGIGTVHYTPFVYHPKSGEINYYRQVSLVIKTKSTKKAKAALQLLNSKSDESISHFVENPNYLKSYPQTASTKSTNYDYLIITPEEFVSEFDGLVNHYTIRGLKTVVKSKEEILTEASGQDAQEKIRNYIIQEYTTNSISYVMLGGDVEHIPYRGFYCAVQSSSVYEDSNIPSDLYYSALDGNWNTDGDNKWGEIDEDDLLPEIAVARFSFSNTSELASMLNKTITYQSNPVLGDLAHPLMVGEHLYDDPITWGSDYLELAIGYQNENGYETTGIPESNTFTKLYDKESTWNSNDLTSQINQGRNFVHHVGHANENTVMKYYTSDITNNAFSGANGTDHQFTNIYTHGCICGSFDASDCIAEQMVKIDNFAAAFVGNSRYGWFNEGQTEGPSAHIHREFVNALYTDRLYRIGMTHMVSKYETASFVNAPGQHEEGALRWCFYDCNVLGDPAMGIWTAEPREVVVNYPSTIVIGQESYNIQISTASGDSPTEINATLLMDGVFHGSETSPTSGSLELELSPVFTNVGTATLWVTGYNMIPQSFEVQVVPAEGAYVVLAECEIDDTSGNNNGELDYGETVNLNLNLQNVGATDAENVVANLTCSNSNISLNNATANMGNILGNGTVELDAAFEITVSDNIENGTAIDFELEFVGDNGTWNGQITINALAPALECVAFHLNDQSGNNNGRLDPGESVVFSVKVVNKGASVSPSLNSILTTETDFISINNGTQTHDALLPDEEIDVDYEVSVSTSANIGDIAHLIMDVSAEAYEANMDYYLSVGLQIEDWESQGFNQYDWEEAGDEAWSISTTEPYEGTTCVESGNIDHNKSSQMYINIEVLSNDSISFYYKVSSEEGYDFLRFFIDETEIEKWSGEENWSRKSYPVNLGSHSFKWSYTKDVGAVSGSDKAWVDYIVFPAMGLINDVSSIKQDIELDFYPNPVQEVAYIKFDNVEEQVITVQLIDPLGKASQISSQSYRMGKQQIELSLDDLASGAYTLVLSGKNSVSTIQFIKM